MANNTPVFRFQDLPGELRNKVYNIIASRRYRLSLPKPTSVTRSGNKRTRYQNPNEIMNQLPTIVLIPRPIRNEALEICKKEMSTWTGEIELDLRYSDELSAVRGILRLHSHSANVISDLTLTATQSSRQYISLWALGSIAMIFCNRFLLHRPARIQNQQTYVQAQAVLAQARADEEERRSNLPKVRKTTRAWLEARATLPPSGDVRLVKMPEYGLKVQYEVKRSGIWADTLADDRDGQLTAEEVACLLWHIQQIGERCARAGITDHMAVQKAVFDKIMSRQEEDWEEDEIDLWEDANFHRLALMICATWERTWKNVVDNNAYTAFWAWEKQF